MATRVQLYPDLRLGIKSVTLTLSSGVGSVPIPETAAIVGVKPVSSTSIRVGLEAPAADGSATGTATAASLAKGVPVDAAVWTWFTIGAGSYGRVLSIKGGSSDVVEVVALGVHQVMDPVVVTTGTSSGMIFNSVTNSGLVAVM